MGSHFYTLKDGLGSRVLVPLLNHALCIMYTKKDPVPIQDSVNYTKVFSFQSIFELMRNTGRRHK